MKYVLMILALVPGFAIAQEVVENVDVTFFAQLVEFIGGVKGMSTLVAVMALIQLLILFMKTKMAGQLFAKLDGALKFLIVNLLTIVVGFLTLVSMGSSYSDAAMKTLALPMVQEFLFQVYKQFFQKKT